MGDCSLHCILLQPLIVSSHCSFWWHSFLTQTLSAVSLYRLSIVDRYCRYRDTCWLYLFCCFTTRLVISHRPDRRLMAWYRCCILPTIGWWLRSEYKSIPNLPIEASHCHSPATGYSRYVTYGLWLASPRCHSLLFFSRLCIWGSDRLQSHLALNDSSDWPAWLDSATISYKRNK